ncbi:MgtC/SapB family protein [Planomicrobium sp. YIM 101495]|uniref:MgtC/SapB family protein n=1 Tax=Planomicrobium sp. YIM 101495 TaxID=2665160 RepID=UPI0012B966C9|nr:MgtC/SapB family protein [Planomicrobium sp. YIM 101495]MTD31821.1 MgtC/SapB family protein [Planomicrobium sp. YIM 101495]
MELYAAFEILSWETFLKLLIAALLSLVIGLERELKRKPVGLKTSMVISTFSCLLTIISIESVYLAEPSEFSGVNVTMDPLRLAAQIVSGIGFLGAGVILKRGNDSISGLTTAAMIWGAGGIGIAVAAGFYLEAATAVLIVLVGIEVLPPLLFRFGPKRLRMEEANMIIKVKDQENIRFVVQELNATDLLIESLSIRKTVDEVDPSIDRYELRVRLGYLQDRNTIDLFQEISEIQNIELVEIELLNH